MIYLFLADGFEEIEAISVIDIIRRANIPLKTVSIQNKRVLGAHQIPVEADILIEEIALNDIEMIILPGGMPGTKNLGASERLNDLLLYAAHQGIYIAAICAAPSILGKLGLLSDKHATCYPGFEGELKGYKQTEKSVVVDGKIITAKGAGVAMEFGYKIVEILASKDLSDKLKQRMIYS